MAGVEQGKGVNPDAFNAASLERKWLEKANRFIELGFHKELNLTPEEYLESLPKFTSQPENFKGRFNTQAIAETRIPKRRQCQLGGIDYTPEGLSGKDWTDDSQIYKTPRAPYVFWTNEGQRKVNKSTQDVRAELALDERGGTSLEAISLYIFKPNLKSSLILPGTAIKSRVGKNEKYNNAAFLNLLSGDKRPRLEKIWVVLNPEFDFLICGRQK
jgi:hypothetical protein